MSVASKNLYSLLSEDGDPASIAVAAAGDKNAKAKIEQAGRQPGARRGGFSGNEAAFRDRGAGSSRNRDRETGDDATRGGSRGGYGARVRGGRGARYPRDRDDRHSKNIAPGSEKQAAQSWGAGEGEAELKDEVAGEEIAKKELKEGEGEPKEVAEPEPEDKHISYADYLAQQAEKKLALDSGIQVRQANEGSKLDKKWANAKPLVKEEDDEFISGSGGKAKRERERKVKQVLEIDQRYVEPERTGGRGGRGGPRGGRGGPRGGSGAPRGAPRGGAGAGGRGGRGGAGKDSAPINTSDQQAFPSLGK